MKRLLILLICCCFATSAWGGVDFNGDSDNIRIESAIVTGYPFTMFCWFTVASITNANMLIWVGDKDVTSNWYGLTMYEGVDGKLAVMAVTPGGFQIAHTSNLATANKWHSACGIFTNATLRRVYLDADVANRGAGTNSLTVADIDRFGIGRDLDTSSSRAHDGKMSEVYVWDVALTEAELVALHNSKVKGFGLQIQPANLVAYYPLDDYPTGTPIMSKPNFSSLKDDANCQGAWAMTSNNGNETDLSGNGETLTDNNSVPTNSVAKQGTTSRLFTGASSEYLSHADNGSTDISGVNQSVSIACWIRRDLDSGGFDGVVGKYDFNSQRQYAIAIDTTDVISGITSSDGNFNAGEVAIGATSIPVDIWFHVAMVYNDTDMRVYVNGLLDANGASNPKVHSNGIFAGTSEFTVGGIFNTGVVSNEFTGLIDEVMVFDRALTAAEVLALYNESGQYRDRSNTNDIIAFDVDGDSLTISEEVLSYP